MEGELITKNKSPLLLQGLMTLRIVETAQPSLLTQTRARGPRRNRRPQSLSSFASINLGNTLLGRPGKSSYRLHINNDLGTWKSLKNNHEQSSTKLQQQKNRIIKYLNQQCLLRKTKRTSLIYRVPCSIRLELVDSPSIVRQK